MEWVTRTDINHYPETAGIYRVMISGDSESMDGFTIYEYDDYETWAAFFIDEDQNPCWNTQHDECNEMIFAFYGPIIIPDYSCE